MTTLVHIARVRMSLSYTPPCLKLCTVLSRRDSKREFCSRVYTGVICIVFVHKSFSMFLSFCRNIRDFGYVIVRSVIISESFPVFMIVYVSMYMSECLSV